MSPPRPKGWSFKQEIKMLRSQMLIHSCIYYELNDNLITDHEWTARAKELARLQDAAKERVGHCSIGFFDEAFANWDGSSGFHLPIRDPWVVDKARWRLQVHHKRRSTHDENKTEMAGPATLVGHGDRQTDTGSV